jgi:hypothetical protein
MSLFSSNEELVISDTRCLENSDIKIERNIAPSIGQRMLNYTVAGFPYSRVTRAVRYHRHSDQVRQSRTGVLPSAAHLLPQSGVPHLEVSHYVC